MAVNSTTIFTNSFVFSEAESPLYSEYSGVVVSKQKPLNHNANCVGVQLQCFLGCMFLLLHMYIGVPMFLRIRFCINLSWVPVNNKSV